VFDVALRMHLLCVLLEQGKGHSETGLSKNNITFNLNIFNEREVRNKGLAFGLNWPLHL
jgi:hypothetical protein